MAAKSFIKPYKILSAGDMSADIVSSITAIQLLDNIGYQINFTGAPVGTFSVEVSMDYEPGRAPNWEPANAGNWITIPLTTAVVAAGAGNSAFIDLNQLSAPYVRLRYTFSSGTGSLDVFVTAKAV